jgi:hypothetical protein
MGIGAVGGGLAGGAVGAVLPVGRAAVPAARNAVVEASERIGVPVPKAAASDSMATQWGGAVASNVPVAGIPLRNAARETLEGLGSKADEVAAGMGGKGAEEAGEAVTKGLRGWIGEKSKKITERVYDAVDNEVDDGVRASAGNTLATAQQIANHYTNAGMAGGSKAVALVESAITNPNNLNYSGVKFLRTQVGEALASRAEGISRDELKALYKSLTSDLEATIKVAGKSPKALALWQRANRQNAQVEARRAEFGQIIGVKKDAPARAVYDALVRMASDKTGQNTKRLIQARKVLGQDWQGAASAVVSRLGRAAKDGREVFSADRFVTDWNNLSPQGKALLFSSNGAHRKALDDIATISGRFKQLNRFANPSGTAQGVVGAGVLSFAAFDPIDAAQSVLPAGALSLILARPATATAFRNYAQAVAKGAQKPIEASARKFMDTVAKETGIAANDNLLHGLIRGPKPIAADQEKQSALDMPFQVAGEFGPGFVDPGSDEEFFAKMGQGAGDPRHDALVRPQLSPRMGQPPILPVPLPGNDDGQWPPRRRV